MSESFAAIRVLVVDDDVYQCNLLQRMLGKIGIFNVYHAASAAAALQIVADRRGSIDVVISDLDMPGMDGPEFFRQLSEQPLDVALLILSGKSDSSLHSAGLQANAYGLNVIGEVIKPARLAVLQEMLASLR